MNVRRMAAAAGIGLLVTGGWASAQLQQQEPTTAELLRQIEELKAKVERLERTSVGGAEVDAVVERVLRDAEQRSRLLAVEGFTAGYDKGKFLIQDAAGNFVLNPNIFFQIRHVVNVADENEDSDIDDGFEVRRAKFSFDGNAFTKKFTYKLQFAAHRDDTGSRAFGGGVFLEDAWVKYQFAPQWEVRLGQFKDPTFHEEVVSSKRQLAVDRSYLNATLGGGVTDRIQGISLIYLPVETVRIETTYFDGWNTDNTDYRDGRGGHAFVGEPEFGVAGRAEWLAWGAGDKERNKAIWKEYEDFSALGKKYDFLVLGGGATYNAGDDNDGLLYTVDAQYEQDLGLGVYAAFIGSQVWGGYDGEGDDRNDYGFLVQAGYLVTDKLEPFARYNVVFFDDAFVGNDVEDTIQEITVGVNYYIYKHSAKLSFDVGYLPDGSPTNQRGIGVVASEDEQFYVRTQFQLTL